MFIRKTLKTDSKSGKSYSAYYLVESTRTDKGPRQKVLLYMGSELPLREEEHKLLAQRIEEIIAGQPPLIPYAEDVERLAQTYASQVIRRLSESVTTDPQTPIPAVDFVTIDVNTMEKSEPRTVGTEHLLLKMAHQLQLPNKLKELGLSPAEIALALGSIIARATHPDSERATYDWLCKRSGLAELLDFPFGKSSHNRLYQISDKLLTHKTALETHLESVEQQFHGYQSTIALYDLTNTYMEGQAKSNPKAAHGVSKEKRTDCPLVTLGLVMNEHGFLNRTSILPGNASEPKTLQEMIKNLDVHQSVFKPIIVLDAGISSEENLQWLKANGYKYKVVERVGRLKEKHKRISGCYEIKVHHSEDGVTATSISWALIDEKMNDKLTGSYFLRTNLVDMGPKELWRLYNTLRGIEDAFRLMKSSLGLRPVYHQKEHRVDGHLWITVLAYHLIQNCLYQLGQQGINHRWETIREIMGSRIRVTTQARTKDDTTLYHRSTTKAEGEQLKIYKALGLSPQILKAQKTIL